MTTELPSRERTDADIERDWGYPDVLFEEARRRRRRRWMAGSALIAAAIIAAALILGMSGGGGGGSAGTANGQPAGPGSGASTQEKLPAPARVDCGDSGVAGAGFTVYTCESGGGDTKYGHPAELLVVRANGSYTGYPNTSSQADIVKRSSTRGIVASHNKSIVQITAAALRTLLSARQLEQLAPAGSRGPGALGAINSLAVTSSGDVFLRLNYYAGDRHGCETSVPS